MSYKSILLSLSLALLWAICGALEVSILKSEPSYKLLFFVSALFFVLTILIYPFFPGIDWTVDKPFVGRVFLITLFGFTIAYLILFNLLGTSNSVKAYALAYISPLFFLLIQYFNGNVKQITVKQVLGVLLTTSGVLTLNL